MAKKTRLYTRLTRATATLGSYRSLWLGPDHLLVVISTGYTEQYRRIQLNNIKGFFVVSSERRSSWMIFWIIIAMLGGIFIMFNFSVGEIPVKSVIFLAIGALGLTWNHLLGPSCKVYVLTGVQTLQLPSLRRRRKAHKVLAKIEPLIADAQRPLQATTVPVAAMPEPPPLP
jgi:hypothetical protein